MKRWKIYSVICLAALYFVTISNCKKTNTSSDLTPPPSSSIDMDFSSFPASKVKSATVVDSTNWGIAYVTVSFWYGATYLYTLIPKLAFIKALENKPTFDDVNKVWLWSYNFTNSTDNYLAELSGKLSEDSVHWVMNISKVGADGKFKYFEGTSHYGKTGGWWILYDPTKGACLKMDWSRQSDQVASLKYTNIIQNDVNKGAFIKFASVATGDYNKYFEARGSADIASTLIEWSSSTRAGRITTKENLKYCWDSTLKSITCP
jgi:hypothetical protein